MNFPDTLSPDHIDQYVAGCAWHNDPTCLCDVDRSKFVVGDGPYVFPTEIVDAYDHRIDGSWLVEALRQLDRNQAKDYLTAQRLHHGELPHAIARHGLGVLVDAVLGCHASGETFDQMAERFGLQRVVITQMAYLLCVPAPAGKRPKPLVLRQRAVAMYDAGYSTSECRKAIEAGGIQVDQSLVTQWVKRYSDRWALENPERLQFVPSRPEYKMRKARMAMEAMDREAAA